MKSIFDLEHPYKTYFKMTLPSVPRFRPQIAAVFYCKKFKNQPRAFSAASTT